MTLLTMIVKMGEGLSKTCAIFFLTLLFSLPLGMIVALLRMSKNRIVSGITRFFISILRGTPLMLQLLAVTYRPLRLAGGPQQADPRGHRLCHQLRRLFRGDLSRRHRIYAGGTV